MNNNLENQAPADTFKSLLQTGNNAGVQGTITTIQDGAGVDTALAISSNAARVNGAFAVTGNLDVAGDFTVNGTTTTINTETLNIEDETLVIASNVDHTQLVQPSGILWGKNENPPQLTYQEGIGFNFSGGDLLKDGNLYGISQLAVTTAGGAFSIDGESRKTLNLQRGLTYRFDQSNATNANHPLKFSEVSDGTHTTPGSEYTVGVITVGTPGQTGAYTQITLTPSTPNLYYYCGNHSGMGGDALGSITIEAGGKVGIGTTNPDEKLHIEDGFLQLSRTIQTNNIIRFEEAGTTSFNIGTDVRENGFFIAGSSFTNNRFFTVTSAGDVGIGNTQPSHDLCLGSATSTGSTDNRLKIFRGADDADQNLEMGYKSITVTRDNTPLTSSQSTFSIIQKGSDGERTPFFIDSGGDVGIGTTNPGAEFEVNGQIISNRRFMSENSLELVSDYNNDEATSTISFKIDGQGADNEKMRITSAGNVGIGTTTPNAKVDARGLVSATNGMVRATGWFTGDSASHGLGCEMGISTFNGVDTGYLMTYNRSASQYGNTMIQSNNAMLKVLGVGESTVELNGNTVRMRRIVEGGFSETAIQIDGTLTVTSTTGGVVLPRMTNAQMTAISATSGEMVFNTTDSKFYGYNGTSWVALH